MKASNISLVALLFFLFSPFQSTLAVKKSYIVYLGSNSYASKFPSAVELQRVTESHHDILTTLLGSKDIAQQSIFYSYTRVLNGFAAVLEKKHAEALAMFPNVISVLENKGRELHTTHSWKFLGLENDGAIPSNSIWNAAKFGQDVIIANLDTGVWPESKSFSDEGYGPVPSRWRGECEGGYNFTCNRKLIGARVFYKGYLSVGGKLNATEITVRDDQGHGTHTLSTAGGNFVSGASIYGYANGTAKGGSPKARVAAYKVCGPMLLFGQCFDADILAGFEAAISDGVDVISVSLGGGSQVFNRDAMAIGAFHAVQQGIVVVCSAGNSGPVASSVANVAPWIVTVGASTIDRDFASYVALGNGMRLKGASLSSKVLPGNKQYPLITGEDGAIQVGGSSSFYAQYCGQTTLDPKKVKGKIVVCVHGSVESVAKGLEAARAGAVGIIVVNSAEEGGQVFPDQHFVPAANLNYHDAQILFQYMNSTKMPVAYITKPSTQLGTKPAPLMASFSSRGPSKIDESLIKPDITAPGVNILASFALGESPTFYDKDPRRIPFNILSGTSMACPHVSGVVGLLRSIYPKWSPAAIRSAIMTSAKTRDNNGHPILDMNMLKETPFAYGSGHINPNGAMDPGLVYDIAPNDYLNFLCARGYNASEIKLFSLVPFACAQSSFVTDLNYPSIAVVNLTTSAVTINRKVKNVGSLGTYVARVKAPAGVAVSIEPSSLQFTSVDEEKTYKVVLKYTGKVKQTGYVFGTLVWSDGKHNVRSPIAVKLVN